MLRLIRSGIPGALGNRPAVLTRARAASRSSTNARDRRRGSTLQKRGPIRIIRSSSNPAGQGLRCGQRPPQDHRVGTTRDDHAWPFHVQHRHAPRSSAGLDGGGPVFVLAHLRPRGPRAEPCCHGVSWVGWAWVFVALPASVVRSGSCVPAERPRTGSGGRHHAYLLCYTVPARRRLLRFHCQVATTLARADHRRRARLGRDHKGRGRRAGQERCRVTRRGTNSCTNDKQKAPSMIGRGL